MQEKNEQIVSFNGIEKRRAFRIDAAMPFTFEDASKQDAGAETKSTLTPEIDSPTDTNTKLLDAVKAIDQKVNFVLRCLCHEYDIDNIFEISEEKEINISASGMRFKCEDEHNVGDLIRVNIDLPYPYMLLSVIGKVVRVEKVEEDKQVYYNIAVNFVSLDDEKESNLVKYLFNCQRKAMKDMSPA